MLNTVLNSVLRSGLTSILGGARGGARGAGTGGGLGGMAGQAALTAALGMLLRRGGGGRLLKVGGAAALGMMAYKAWQDYQARQGSKAPAQRFAPPDATTPTDAQEQALLVAMIAAARADGHVDADERAQIEQALAGAQEQPADATLMAWLDAELKRPLDAASVARAAAGQPELASQMYLASVIVVGGAAGSISASEQAWLDALARELQLPDALRASLHGQAAQVGA